MPSSHDLSSIYLVTDQQRCVQILNREFYLIVKVWIVMAWLNQMLSGF